MDLTKWSILIIDLKGHGYICNYLNSKIILVKLILNKIDFLLNNKN